MITIKMYGEKWRIGIGDEVWEFENFEEMFEILRTILEMKNDYGRLDNW